MSAQDVVHGDASGEGAQGARVDGRVRAGGGTGKGIPRDALGNAWDAAQGQAQSWEDVKLKRRHDEDRLGKDIVDECRVQLMMKFRFLDLALWRMELVPLRVGALYPLATDGKQVVYDPPRVISRFQESFEESVRDYLHLTMHCVFRHPFDKGHDNRDAWGLACDIVVESAVVDLCGARFASEDDPARLQAASEIKMLAGSLLPNKVYALVKNVMRTPDGQHYRGLGPSVIAEWRALFERDDHGSWPANNDAKGSASEPDARAEMSEDNENPEAQADSLHAEGMGDETDGAAGGGQDEAAGEDVFAAGDDGDEAQEEEGGAAGEEDGQEAASAEEAAGDDASDGADDADGAEDDEPSADDAPDEQDAGGDNPPDAFRRNLPDEADQDEREWEDVAKQIEMNLETFSKEWGDEAGSLVANLAFANRKTCDYTDFLRRFMAVGEEMRLNMDEFDYLFYTYGLDLYGNMPLVEPLEYKETQRVHDFAIVIDTSESVSGSLVKRFVRHTFGILKSSEDYAREVNIHLIQCDARVQSDLKITDLESVDALMEDFRIRGFGGTDFRPAFDYVDLLRKRGELADLKGLVYFTDGFGSFPEKPPDYEAAFVFMDDGTQTPPVPPWACKVLVDEEGIGRLNDAVVQ